MTLMVESFWGRFARDPRAPEYAGLRAAYADREIVLDALGEAYAEGRLDADEFEQRSDATQAARTLGELPPLLADLLPAVVPAERATVTPETIQRRAVEKWEKNRRDALSGFLGPSIICWVIWAAVMFGGFPWPLFVMAGTGVNLVATQVRRQDIIAAEVRRLERRAEKERAQALDKEKARRELESGDAESKGSED